MRLLALSGSPRRGGNTEVLMDAAINGAKQAGADVVHFRLRDLEISPCLECRTCDRTGECIVKDEMWELYPHLETADRVLISSPIFFYSVSGWAKAAIDRCQPFWARKYVLNWPQGGADRWGAFIAVGATKGKKLFEGAVLTIKYCFADVGFKYAGDVLVRGVENLGDMKQHPEHVEAARRLGRNLVLSPEQVGRYEP